MKKLFIILMLLSPFLLFGQDATYRNVTIVNDLTINGLTTATGTESTNDYTSIINSRWNSGDDIPTGGGFGLHGRAYINNTTQNVVGTRGVLYFDGLEEGEDINQGRGIEGAINLDVTYGLEISDDVSAIGGYLGPYNAANNTSPAPGQGTISVVDLVYLLETDMDLNTHGIRLVAKSTSAGVKMDYGFRIVNQGVTTANIFLENEDQTYTSITNDILMTSVEGDVINGINMSGAVYSGSDWLLQNGGTIDNVNADILTLTETTVQVDGIFNIIDLATADPVVLTIDVGGDVDVLATLDIFAGSAAVGGTGDAITIDFTPDYPALSAGAEVMFIAEANNTGATTLTLDGGAAVNIFEASDISALDANDIKDGMVVHLLHDGTQWQQISQSGN